MANDNVTPIGPPPGLPAKCLADKLSAIQESVHASFCTLLCASAGLEKAENDDDADLWIRASRVVQRCCDDLNQIRDSVDDAVDCAVRAALTVPVTKLEAAPTAPAQDSADASMEAMGEIHAARAILALYVKSLDVESQPDERHVLWTIDEILQRGLSILDQPPAGVTHA